jgi:serine/threonine-protein kinase
MNAAQAKMRIRNGWIAGVITAAATLFASLLPLLGISLAGFNLWNLTDFALIAGLTLGIARKSRVCALMMLAYFVVSRISLVAQTADIPGAVLGAILAFIFFEGVRGAFAWHQLARVRAPEPPLLVP